MQHSTQHENSSNICNQGCYNGLSPKFTEASLNSLIFIIGISLHNPAKKIGITGTTTNESDPIKIKVRGKTINQILVLSLTD